VLLHGYDDDPRALWGSMTADPSSGSAVCAISGPLRTASGRAWYDPLADAVDDDSPLAATLDALRAVIVECGERAGVGPGSVEVVGWSQGAAVALALGFSGTKGWRPSSVTALAGWLPNEPDVSWDFEAAAAAGTSARLVHGSRDDVVPVAQGRSAFRVLSRHGVDATWIEVDASHDLRPLLEVARDTRSS
jgi:phospholipase/carboxylesterase